MQNHLDTDYDLREALNILQQACNWTVEKCFVEVPTNDEPVWFVYAMEMISKYEKSQH